MYQWLRAWSLKAVCWVGPSSFADRLYAHGQGTSAFWDSACSAAKGNHSEPTEWQRSEYGKAASRLVQCLPSESNIEN
jgi:hypothetical protein